MANKVEITMSQKDMNKKFSRMDHVQDALKKHAQKIEAVSKHLLSIHRDKGRHRIEMGHERNVKYGTIDWYVSLVGPAPISVEFGHRTKNGKWVSGLYIITAGLSVR